MSSPRSRVYEVSSRELMSPTALLAQGSMRSPSFIVEDLPMACFEPYDDAFYLAWLDTNPDGYVINAEPVAEAT